jgi:hypothetical protein
LKISKVIVIVVFELSPISEPDFLDDFTFLVVVVVAFLNNGYIFG